MLTRKYFPALQKTEILPENPVSETRNHTLELIFPYLADLSENNGCWSETLSVNIPRINKSLVVYCPNIDITRLAALANEMSDLMLSLRVANL